MVCLQPNAVRIVVISTCWCLAALTSICWLDCSLFWLQAYTHTLYTSPIQSSLVQQLGGGYFSEVQAGNYGLCIIRRSSQLPNIQ